jgi:thiamine biosynthesis lipoprotein ApbE
VSATGRADFRALGTGCAVVTTDPMLIDRALACVDAELALVDAACSRFRDDSELTELNRAGGAPTVVSARLMDAIDVALRAAQLTAGDLDPTIGSSLRALGYDRDFGAIAREDGGVLTIRAVSGWQRVRCDRDTMAVTIPAGVELDLGATAKAWAADRAADAAARAVQCGVLLSLGGDIATAGPAPLDGWPVQIADSHAAAPDSAGATVTITSGGLATSSTTVRRWTRGGTELHHIIDPRTARPALEVWRTVSVAAATCTDANIASTTSVIRGARALAWLDSVGLPARLVTVDGRVVVCNGWPADNAGAR